MPIKYSVDLTQKKKIIGEVDVITTETKYDTNYATERGISTDEVSSISLDQIDRVRTQLQARIDELTAQLVDLDTKRAAVDTEAKKVTLVVDTPKRVV